MRLLVDATSVEFGGIRTYANQLLRAWASSYPEDELLVAVPAGADLQPGGHERVEVRWHAPALLGRPAAQSRVLPGLARRRRVDAVLATNPTTSLRWPGAPMIVVVHDLRHELRPDQFTRLRRALRWAAYRRSYALADGFVAVSNRTLADLHALHPSTTRVPSAVVRHGADHVLDWPLPDQSGPVVAFGHHSNKNPDLVVDAWSVLAARGVAPQLTIIGLGERDRARMAGKVTASAVERHVHLAPFLEESAFRATFAHAAAVVFPSEFEGFGLPILEAMLLGKPVVIGPDPGALEAAGGHAIVSADWSAPAVADATQRALTLDARALAAARAYAAGHLWSDAADRTRALVKRVICRVPSA